MKNVWLFAPFNLKGFIGSKQTFKIQDNKRARIDEDNNIDNIIAIYNVIKSYSIEHNELYKRYLEFDDEIEQKSYDYDLWSGEGLPIIDEISISPPPPIPLISEAEIVVAEKKLPLKSTASAWNAFMFKPLYKNGFLTKNVPIIEYDHLLRSNPENLTEMDKLINKLAELIECEFGDERKEAAKKPRAKKTVKQSRVKKDPAYEDKIDIDTLEKFKAVYAILPPKRVKAPKIADFKSDKYAATIVAKTNERDELLKVFSEREFYLKNRRERPRRLTYTMNKVLPQFIEGEDNKKVLTRINNHIHYIFNKDLFEWLRDEVNLLNEISIN